MKENTNLFLGLSGDINDPKKSWWYVGQGKPKPGLEYIIFNREDYPDPPFICLGVRDNKTGKMTYTHCHQFKFDEWKMLEWKK